MEPVPRTPPPMPASDAEGAAPRDDTEQQRIAEARVKTGDFIARLMMAYAGFAAFCVFALLSPDRLMIEAKASLNMPFAGAVSFLAFMAVAPVVLIGIRVYLEVYVQRWRQLDAQLDADSEPKTISPFPGCFLLSDFPPVVYHTAAWNWPARISKRLTWPGKI